MTGRRPHSGPSNNLSGVGSGRFRPRRTIVSGGGGGGPLSLCGCHTRRDTIW